MSSAFVKEGEYEKLNEIEPTLSALSLYIRRENGGQAIREIRSFYSDKCGRHVYEMSDGLTYALNDETNGRSFWRLVNP